MSLSQHKKRAPKEQTEMTQSEICKKKTKYRLSGRGKYLIPQCTINCPLFVIIEYDKSCHICSMRLKRCFSEIL